jgi:beta-lactamase superfamily II metal-dependent hydrolase
MHIPGIGWGVLDSCKFKIDGKNRVLPLEYLRAQKVQALAFAFLSHPHEDHFQGLDEVIEAYPQVSTVGRYSGDSDRELKKYWARHDLERVEPLSDSLARVFNSMKHAADRGAKYFRLAEMKELYNVQATIKGKHCHSKLVALSPSGISEELYADALRRNIPKNGRIKHLKEADYNLIACAIMLEVNKVKILLGSDVEKGGHIQTGWKGICTLPGSPDLAADAIKVAHHGSSGSHHQPAWSMHRKRNPVAIVTPYCKGKHHLPGNGDMKRIREHSSKIGLTGEIEFSDPGEIYPTQLVNLSRFNFRNWQIRRTPENVGYIRLRYDLSGRLIESGTAPPSMWFS